MRSLNPVLLALCCMSLAASAATLHVPAGYPTIQEAIDAALDGDTVLVAPGTYVENIDFKGKSIEVRSSDGAAATVIDGNRSGSVVTFQNGEANALLMGFTITNGSGNSVPPFNYGAGAGIHCNFGSSPAIRENIITSNAGALGGGICCILESSPLIENNTISMNSVAGMSSAGGGIYCLWNSDPVITGNTILGNASGEYGGGIECASHCNPRIEGNLIAENSTAVYNGAGIDCFDHCAPVILGNLIGKNASVRNGGGISCDLQCAPIIANNVFFMNTAAKVGGGIDIIDSFPVIIGNTLHQNQAGVTGGGMRFGGGSDVVVANTILWDNGAPTGPEIRIGGESLVSIRHSDVMGGQGSVYLQTGSTLVWGAGMIDADPLFADAAAGDYHIECISPCRDAGDSAAPGLPATDFEGDPRIAYGVADIGADEFHPHLYYTGTAAPGGSVSLKLTGMPGTNPVCLWWGSGVLDPPWPTPYGDWYLAAPLSPSIFLGPFPPEGILTLSGAIQPGYPSWDIPFQALIGNTLTNLCVMEIE